MDDTQISPKNASFLKHIKRCHNANLPGDRLPFYYKNDLIGWVDPHVMPTLNNLLSSDLLNVNTNKITLYKGEALNDLSLALAHHDYYNAFHEWFDVRNPHGQVIGQIDRGLIPILGVEACGVHLNGLVKKDDTLFLWVAKRSPLKRLDPGKFDHLVAGGISSGYSSDATLIKEAGEEASITPHMAHKAQYVSTLEYAMSRPEGLRRDRLYCYDIFLPNSFLPRAADGEVESFQLIPLREVFCSVRDNDNFKFNVNLVLIDLFIRYNFFSERDKTILSQSLYPSFSKYKS